MAVYISLLAINSFIILTNARLVIDDESRTTFDRDLYKRVLDREQCGRQMDFMLRNATIMYARFLDSGFRIPRGLFTLGSNDLGDYPQCLGIHEQVQDMTIAGKYCLIQIPLTLPFETEAFNPLLNLRNKTISSFHNGILSNVQRFAVGDGDTFEPQTTATGGVGINLAVCIPKVCTTEDWIQNGIFNLSAIGFQFEESFCRLPDDKPWVAADYVAIGIFSLIAFLTVISTIYDVNHIVIQKKDPKQAILYCRIFSVYTNTIRLVTFSPNTNALGCLDGLRGISVLWVIIGHTFMMDNFNFNPIDVITWLTSGDAVWITTGLFAVDTFLMMTGLLLVYTSVGKMTKTSLIKRLHLFYLHRLLRLFPLLAALVLLEASVFHRMADGPFWLHVAEIVQSCRTFWWSTLLHVQNYVNPDHMCVPHSWYIAIDVQLYIVSPLILFWVVGKNRKLAWTALVAGLLAILVASTVWNFIKAMPSSIMAISRIEEMAYYMNNYYRHALTRAAPFFIGMIVGYILAIYKGKQIKLNMAFVLISWGIALGLIACCFYTSYVIVQFDWDNQVGDSLFNSFMRSVWAVGHGWIIFACTKGYGGPVNWFLSHPVWRVPARISYAMYLYHYPLMFVVAGMQLAPKYFSQGARIYEFMSFLVISLLVAFVMTIVIDAPFSMITKLIMEGGHRKQKPTDEQVAGSSKGPLSERDTDMLENNMSETTLVKNDLSFEENDHTLHTNGTLENHLEFLDKNDLTLEQEPAFHKNHNRERDAAN